MKRRIVKVTILLIIFGVPVIWYLFLQLFGENKFELKPIRTISESCPIAPSLIYLAQKPSDLTQENQLNRLISLLNDRNQTIDSSYVSCISDTAHYALYLIDEEQQLRGYYDLTILEVDRLVVEIDLLKVMK